MKFTGSKGAGGVVHRIIGQMPLHSVYAASILIWRGGPAASEMALTDPSVEKGE
jgi:hypothetical protein